MKTKLYIVRHARTDWNAERRIQGSTERSLDEVGRQEAREMGQKLSSLPITAVYASPMQRTRETAAFITSHHSCEVFYDHALREGAFGSIEGMTWEEYHRDFAQQILLRNQISKEERFVFKMDPGAESPAEIAERALPALHQICIKHPGSHIVVVTHGGVMKTLLAHIGGYDDRKILISNAALLYVEGDGKDLTILQHEGVTI